MEKKITIQRKMTTPTVMSKGKMRFGQVGLYTLDELKKVPLVFIVYFSCTMLGDSILQIEREEGHGKLAMPGRHRLKDFYTP